MSTLTSTGAVCLAPIGNDAPRPKIIWRTNDNKQAAIAGAWSKPFDSLFVIESKYFEFRRIYVNWQS